ncbi:MAG: maleylacetoacetate isomerase [Rhodoferax sp.]
MKLYTYFRSSAAYRVRIALNLKGLPFESIPVHLLRDGGAQHSADYVRLNATQLVPTLVDGALTTGQSLAIIEYLEDAYTKPALLPADPSGRARVRALSQSIACEIHPLNNLRVLQYLEHELKIDESARAKWYRHWITLGFTALESMLEQSSDTGVFCHSNSPTMADCCLIPQIANARRFNTALDAFPHIRRIESACLAMPEFERAAPGNQPDAV